jgi:hypothetical protein
VLLSSEGPAHNRRSVGAAVGAKSGASAFLNLQPSFPGRKMQPAKPSPFAIDPKRDDQLIPTSNQQPATATAEQQATSSRATQSHSQSVSQPASQSSLTFHLSIHPAQLHSIHTNKYEARVEYFENTSTHAHDPFVQFNSVSSVAVANSWVSFSINISVKRGPRQTVNQVRLANVKGCAAALQ